MRFHGGEADDSDSQTTDRRENARPRPRRPLPRPFFENVGGEERIGRLRETPAERGQPEIELMVADCGRGQPDAVEGVDYRTSLELVGDQRALELVAAVQHDGLAVVRARL